MTPNIAFKEWAAVCVAIASGVQTIILRKGGISEANGEFKPEHPRFWLYPTYFHEDRSTSLKPGPWLAEAERLRPAAGAVVLQTIIDVIEVTYLRDLGEVQKFDSQHIWTPATVEQRFHYRTPGLYLLKVQATNVEPVTVIEKPEYAGCKTWVQLGEI